MKRSRLLAALLASLLSAAGSLPAAFADAPASPDRFARPGFYTQVQDGRLWVFREGSEELKALRRTGT